MLVMVLSSTASQQATLIPRTLYIQFLVCSLQAFFFAIVFVFNFHNDFKLGTRKKYSFLKFMTLSGRYFRPSVRRPSDRSLGRH